MAGFTASTLQVPLQHVACALATHKRQAAVQACSDTPRPGDAADSGVHSRQAGRLRWRGEGPRYRLMRQAATVLQKPNQLLGPGLAPGLGWDLGWHLGLGWVDASWGAPFWDYSEG